MNLPNTLTVSRIFFVPLLVVVLLTEFDELRIAGVPREPLAAVIFAVASVTDWLDGYLARRRRQVTTLGRLLDPLADKLLVSAALVSLVQLGQAPAWMVAIILGRELAVTALRGLAHTRGVVIAASGLGKAKMVCEVVAILALMLSGLHPGLLWLGHTALWVVLGVAIYSGFDYYRRFNYVINPKIADFPAAAAKREQLRRVASR